MDATLFYQITPLAKNCSAKMFRAFQEFFTNLPANFEGGTDQLTLLKLFKVNHIHIISLKNWEMAILKISSVVFQKLYGLFAK